MYAYTHIHINMYTILHYTIHNECVCVYVYVCVYECVCLCYFKINILVISVLYN